ncbi:MAG: MarR family transcriptional regulator [Clostridiales bacterium]|nr:MarR family transcriptional regulator [Clostridiales bacterium]
MYNDWRGECAVLICDLSILHRYGKRKLDDKLRPLIRTWRKAVVLLVLDKMPGAELPLLSQMLQTDKGNVSRLLSRMEQDGLLLRQVPEQDGRRKELLLSERGRALVPRVNDAMDSWERECFSGLTPEQIETYTHLNKIVMANVYDTSESFR